MFEVIFVKLNFLKASTNVFRALMLGQCRPKNVTLRSPIKQICFLGNILSKSSSCPLKSLSKRGCQFAKTPIIEPYTVSSPKGVIMSLQTEVYQSKV